MGVQKRNLLVPLDRRCRVEAGELAKENLQLYNKKQKDWFNVEAGNSWWDRVGKQLELPATGFQCREHYEIMVGKIMKKKSVSGQP